MSLVLLSSYRVALANRLWPNGLILYTFNKNVPKKVRDIVREAGKEWETVSQRIVKFREVQSQGNEHVLEVSYSDGEGAECWADVGFQYLPEMRLSDRCYYAIILHEWGHVIGLSHEHQRSDRDKYITIHWGYIPLKYTNQFKKNNKYIPDIGAYDINSIMHYGAYVLPGPEEEYVKYPIITPKPLIGAPFPAIPEHMRRISSGDIEKLRILYIKGN